MKDNKELEREDIAVDADMQVDDDIGQEILAYLETWFDVDKKFNIHTAEDDGAWLNMYARFNPYADTLKIECEIDTDDSSPNRCFDYEPSAAEERLIKDMITQKIEEIYGRTPQEFCEAVCGEDQSMGGLS